MLLEATHRAKMRTAWANSEPFEQSAKPNLA